MLKHIIELYNKLKRKVILQWIPAHEEILDNETTNQAIKKTTEWKQKRREKIASTSSKLKILTSTAKFKIKKWIKTRWTQNWKTKRHEKTTHKLILKLHKKSLKKFRKLKRTETFMLIQIRTGKITLQNYLHKIKIEKSKFCECDEVKNVHHVLLQCSKWAKLRIKYFEHERRDLQELLKINALIKKFTTFFHETELLKQFRYATLKSIFDDKKNRSSTQNNDEFSDVTISDSTSAITSMQRMTQNVISMNVCSHTLLPIAKLF